jgi:hypothetical protein
MVFATAITIVNCDRKTSILQASGYIESTELNFIKNCFVIILEFYALVVPGWHGGRALYLVILSSRVRVEKKNDKKI